MQKINLIIVNFILISYFSFSQKIEKYRIYPSLTFEHYYANCCYEDYSKILRFGDFLKYKYYSSYNPKKNNFLLGLGENKLKKILISGDSLFVQAPKGNKLFIVLNKDFYGDSTYVENFGKIKNSYIKLNEILYDINLDDTLYRFSVRTLDKSFKPKEDEAVALVNRSKIRITRFIFSKKYGFYMVAYDDLDGKYIIEEYYNPFNRRKMKRLAKKRERKLKQIFNQANKRCYKILFTNKYILF